MAPGNLLRFLLAKQIPHDNSSGFPSIWRHRRRNEVEVRLKKYSQGKGSKGVKLKLPPLARLEKSRSEVASSNAEQRAKFEEEAALLNQKLAEAEAKNQRALSMAQQTQKGNVYIISNAGSFGDEIFKIGMTRRLEPMDRVDELSDASVPFDFDVHAMIPCEDPPALEAALHHAFDDLRINQVNFRKEFFRVPLERVRSLITEKGIDASFTMLADAHEWRETQVINKMTPEEREKYYLSRDMESAANIKV